MVHVYVVTDNEGDVLGVFTSREAADACAAAAPRHYGCTVYFEPVKQEYRP